MSRFDRIKACAEQAKKLWQEIRQRYEALLLPEHSDRIASISGRLSRLLEKLGQSKEQIEMKAIWDSVETAPPMEKTEPNRFPEEIRNEFRQLTGEIEELIGRVKQGNSVGHSEDGKRCAKDLVRFGQAVETWQNVLFQTPKIAFLPDVDNFETDNRGGRILEEG